MLLIFLVSSDKKIQMYDGKTGLATMDVPIAHSMGIYSIAFSPDSSHFITASADKTVKLWNAETLVCEQTLSMSSDPKINDAQVYADEMSKILSSMLMKCL